MTDGKSSVYATNISGSNTEPWGTLQSIMKLYQAIQSNLGSLSSISQVGLISFEHQICNPKAIFEDVKENLMVDGIKSSAQVQKDKNTDLTSEIDVSCNVIVYGDERSLGRMICTIGGLADR